MDGCVIKPVRLQRFCVDSVSYLAEKHQHLMKAFRGLDLLLR